MGEASTAMATVSAMKAHTADNNLGLLPELPCASSGSGCTCQNSTTPARARPTMVKKPTLSTTVQTQACAGRPELLSKIMSLPKKPGKGGKPAADAAPNSSIRPSSTGSRTATAGRSLSKAWPRCAAISSTSKNRPAITMVLCRV